MKEISTNWQIVMYTAITFSFTSVVYRNVCKWSVYSVVDSPYHRRFINDPGLRSSFWPSPTIARACTQRIPRSRPFRNFSSSKIKSRSNVFRCLESHEMCDSIHHYWEAGEKWKQKQRKKATIETKGNIMLFRKQFVK